MPSRSSPRAGPLIMLWKTVCVGISHHRVLLHIPRFSNARGEGKVFSFDLLDRDGGEIRATAFGAEADKFFEIIEVSSGHARAMHELKLVACLCFVLWVAPDWTRHTAFGVQR